jgi:hypothetical protein
VSLARPLAQGGGRGCAPDPVPESCRNFDFPKRLFYLIRSSTQRSARSAAHKLFRNCKFCMKFVALIPVMNYYAKGTFTKATSK